MNGPSQTVSDVTVRFALASVIFEIETGIKPDLTLVNNNLKLPAVEMGNKILDSVIERAWLGNYESTMDMLVDIESLSSPSRSESGPDLQSTAIESLRTQVDDWRRIRVRKHGEFSSGQRLLSRLLTLLPRSSIPWSVYGRPNQSSQGAPKIGTMFR